VTAERSAGLRGRLPAKAPSERLPIGYVHTYMRSPLESPRYPIDVSGGITEWQMLGNGPDPTLTANGGQPVGDCTFAGRQHLRMAKAAAVGKTETWETADQLVTEYLAYDHGVDRGANIAEVLLSWFVHGKIMAFAPVDHSDAAGCDAVMGAFHGLYVGVDLTANADTEFEAGHEWTLQPGDGPDPSNGHCIVKVKADGEQSDTWVTWGALQQSTRDWTTACIREAWAVVTTEDEAAKLNMPKLVSDIVSASKAAMTTVEAETRSQPNQAATSFSLGWQMAQLYGPLADTTPDTPADHLPAIPEYGGDARGQLAIDELKSLLGRADLTDVDTGGLDSWVTQDATGRRTAVLEVHYRILDSLVCTDPPQAASYQLGGALSDTIWLPDTDHHLPPTKSRVQVFLDQFSQDRLARLHGWLREMNSLAPGTAPIVGRSLQNWADWVDTNRKVLLGDWSRNESEVVAALRNQSNAWHGSLSSADSGGGLPPMGAWIHAGEQIVRTTETLTRRMLRWFWPAVVIILAVTGALLYLALNNGSETAKVWTSLVTVAGSVGISVAGIRTGAKKLATGLESTTFQAATADAEAWNITWLPTLKQNRGTSFILRYRLRQRGIDPPGRAAA
jgi:hypothetical protein